MLKNKKIMLIILAGLIAVLAVTGIIFYVVGSFGKHDTAMLTAPTNSDNRVEFRDNVHIADNSEEIQKNFDSLSAENEEYTITYKNSLPDFFKGMQIGEIFCVYPDSGVANSFFSLGFSGIITDIGENTVSFTVPKLSDVFSDIYINSNTSDGNDVISASFQPSENITDVRYMRKKEPPYALASVP